ncbi:hypothetical protein Tco_1215691 [Tanacetum coccineum]
MFEIYCRSLEINPSVNLFSAFYKLNKQGHWFSFERRSGKGGHDKIFNEFCTSLKHWKDRFFLIDRRAIPDAMPWRHQNSSVADPPPTGVRAEDIRRLCENIIDLRPVHPAMLYAIGLTTIWKHVGHHPVFKDGEGTVATSMSQFLKFSMAGGVRVGKGATLVANEVIPQHTTQPLPFGSHILEKSDRQKVVEYENERVLAAKRKAQAARDKATGNRSAAEGTSRRTKKKKGAPLTFALDEFEGDDSTRSGFGTHHSASPLNTIILDDVDPTTSEGSPILEFVRREEDDADRSLNNVEDAIKANSPPVDHSLGPNTLTVLTKIHMSRGEFFFRWFRASGFPKRNPGGDGAGCARKEAALAKKLVVVEKEKDDLLDKSRAQEDRIKHLEEALASKTSSLSEAESVAGTLKGDLERLTLDLSHVEIVRHNYVRHLLPTVFQRLLSNDEYKKSLFDVFNQAIAAGWSEGVKVERFVEDAEAILADATDYDPGCKATFMSAFDALFCNFVLADGSHPVIIQDSLPEVIRASNRCSLSSLDAFLRF